MKMLTIYLRAAVFAVISHLAMADAFAATTATVSPASVKLRIAPDFSVQSGVNTLDMVLQLDECSVPKPKPQSPLPGPVPNIVPDYSHKGFILYITNDNSAIPPNFSPPPLGEPRISKDTPCSSRESLTTEILPASKRREICQGQPGAQRRTLTQYARVFAVGKIGVANYYSERFNAPVTVAYECQVAISQLKGAAGQAVADRQTALTVPQTMQISAATKSEIYAAKLKRREGTKSVINDLTAWRDDANKQVLKLSNDADAFFNALSRLQGRLEECAEKSYSFADQAAAGCLSGDTAAVCEDKLLNTCTRETAADVDRRAQEMKRQSAEFRTHLNKGLSLEQKIMQLIDNR